MASAALWFGLLATPGCLAGLSTDSNAELSPGGGDPMPADRANGPGNVPSDHLPPTMACTTPGTPAPRALRRLTSAQMSATLADLFGSMAQVPSADEIFTGDPTSFGYTALTPNLVVGPASAAKLQQLSEAAGELAAKTPSLVTSCTSPDADCQQKTIAAFGARAFRAPLSPEQVADYQKLMAQAKDFPGQLKIMVSAMLQSPHFIYRAELGDKQEDGSYRLTPFELAAQISYMTTGSMPDAQLTAAAADGSLLKAEVQAQQAARLLADPRAHRVLDRFFLEWLDLPPLATMTVADGADMLEPSVRADMVEEARRLVDQMAFDPKATYASLMTSEQTFVNDNLKKFYGLSGGGGDFTAAPRESRAAGVLGLGAVLARHSGGSFASPTLRGRMVRMHLLCDPLNSPPPGTPQLGGRDPSKTVRQQFEQHASSPTCASCHRLMDPLGYTMGAFDALGRTRPNGMEGEHPVDVAGAVEDAKGAEAIGLPGGLADLSTALSTDPRAQACMVQNMVMFSLGSLSWQQNGCTFAAATEVASHSQFSLQQSYLAVMSTPSFTRRVMDP